MSAHYLQTLYSTARRLMACTLASTRTPTVFAPPIRSDGLQAISKNDVVADTVCLPRCRSDGPQRGTMTRFRRAKRLALGGLSGAMMLVPTLAQAGSAPGPIKLDVDASDTLQRIIRVRESLPVTPGPLTLLYPRWVPGSHSPSANPTLLAGLAMTAGGRAIPWLRHPDDVHAFSVQIPSGADRLELEFQYLSPLQDTQGRVVITPSIVAIPWNTVVLYPRGLPVEQQLVEATVQLPAGWQLATSLDVQRQMGNRTEFKPVNLAELVDSPVWSGPNVNRVDLQADAIHPVFLNVFSDAIEDTRITPEQIAAWRAMVQQTFKVFGPPPFRRYEFLLSLNAGFSSIGREHLSSTELSGSSDYFAKWVSQPYERNNIAHEFVHVWNGKAAVPVGLAPTDFNVPLDTSDVWIYEGQTEYWGQLLRARSGELTRELTLQSLARSAAQLAYRRGHEWRSLQDTTFETIMRYDRSRNWSSWQRGVDYYAEGAFLWLAVDARLRQRSAGRKSLDDFARDFFKGLGAGDGVRRYTRADIYAALGAVEADDWYRFIEDQLERTHGDIATEALEAAGWKLVFKDKQNDYDAMVDRGTASNDFIYSIGVAVTGDGRVTAVQWDSAAFKAGLAPGATLVAVNSRSFSATLLRQAITDAVRTHEPIELLAKADDRFRTVSLRYDQGLRYPHLERLPDRPDLLSKMLAPRE